MMRFSLKNKNLQLFAGLVFLIQTSVLFAQSSNPDIENKKVEVEKAINYTNELINETQVKKQATLTDLSMINQKITLRKSLIQALDQEKEIFLDTIFQKLASIERINTELVLLKDEYTKMIRSAYKNRNMHQRLLYIFAADDFAQAYRRMNYYKIYAQQRQKQVMLIEKANKRFIDEVKSLMEKMAQIEETRIDVSQEQEKLDSEKMLKNEVVKNLVKKEKELITTQKKFQSQADLLKNKIEQTIHEENLNGNYGSTTGDNSPTTSHDEINMTDSFTAQRGKLPWPLEKGVISSEYGEHDHPDLKGIKVKNNGINIATGLNSKARVVFDGVVTRVMKVPNFNNVVIVRHGEYLSVYSNLDNVFVTKGIKVSAGQEIGTLFAPVGQQKSELHFEIWKGKNQLDPTQWISTENR